MISDDSGHRIANLKRIHLVDVSLMPITGEDIISFGWETSRETPSRVCLHLQTVPLSPYVMKTTDTNSVIAIDFLST